MLLFNGVMPIFLIIALGWWLARIKVLTDVTAQQLMLFVFWVCGPAIIFVYISDCKITTITDGKFWLAYSIGLAVITFTIYCLYRYLFKERIIVSTIAGFSATVKNTLMIGFPLLIALVGKAAAIPVAITVIVFNCIVTPLLILVFELDNTAKSQSKFSQIIISAIISTLSNPFVAAAIAGLLFAYFQWHLPASIQLALTHLAAGFVPCALLAVGIELSSFRLFSNFGKIALICLFNLIAAPVLAILLAHLLKLTPTDAFSLVILSAVPTAKSMYIYSKKYDVFEKETAAIISTTTVLSLVTIPIFVYTCSLYWPSALLTAS